MGISSINCNTARYLCKLLLVLFLTTPEPALSTMHSYYIIPITAFCNNTISCLTLGQFATQSQKIVFHKNNITLIFARGSHKFDGGITISGADSVILKGESFNGSRADISCTRKCFFFTKINSLLVANLSFSDCSSELDGGAFLVQTASKVFIGECYFKNNSATCQGTHDCQTCYGSGGAISIAHTTSVVIEKSIFDLNTAICYGGALFVVNSSLEIISSKGFQNSGYAYKGGTLYAYMSKVKAVNITFGYSSAVIGGSIAAEFSILAISDSTFVDNKAIEGGAVFVSKSRLKLFGNNFTLNTAERVGGGIHGRNSSNIQILGSIFARNFAFSAGGVAAIQNSNVAVINATFYFNAAPIGGVLTVLTHYKCDITISESVFIANFASHNLGAAMVLYINGFPNCLPPVCSKDVAQNDSRTIVHISNSIFTRQTGGTVKVDSGVLNITNCTFEDNLNLDRDQGGGAIDSTSNILFISFSTFTNNSGVNGGVILITRGLIVSYSNTFKSNKAFEAGGVFNAINTTIFMDHDLHDANSAGRIGGVAYATYNVHLYINSCTFNNNIASGLTAGVINIFKGSINSKNSVYKSNYARTGGGALFLETCTASLSGDLFYNNTADLNKGAVIFQGGDVLYSINSTFNENKAIYRDIKYIVYLTNTRGIFDGMTFTRNDGSISLFNCHFNFSRIVTLMNNTATFGGALRLIQSMVSFQEQSQLTITGNIARYGGALFLSETKLSIFTSSFVLSENIATISGGGIFGYQSQINVNVDDLSFTVWIVGNIANREGGAINAISTTLKLFYGYVQISNNQASKGGALSLSEGSRINIQKIVEEKTDNLTIKLSISNNLAEYGGGIFILDTSNSGILCDQSPGPVFGESLSSKDCVIQSLSLYYTRDFSGAPYFNYINIFFHSNTAQISGRDIYGGVLDRCKINAFSELSTKLFVYGYDSFNGFDYIKSIAKFDLDINYEQLTNPFDPLAITTNLTKQNFKELISSDAVQLCICTDSVNYICSYQHPRIFVRRGEAVSIKAVVVDQIENPVNGTVLSTVISVGTSLGVDQSHQATIKQCTDLTYNIFSSEANASIELFPNGPCVDMGISRKVLNFTFLPCDCPNGFQPAALDNECKCDCDSVLDSLVHNCKLDRDNNTVTVVRLRQDIWIQYIINNSGKVPGFIHTECPQDYCIQQPVNLSISLPWGVDKQCAMNRSGILCGQCKKGLSLVFGSATCKLCDNNTFALLLVFALAGIILVALILILNGTVAIGTIHGLILYSNIISANSSTFLPFETGLRVFISWVNLDVGIETCFYNGMDSYAKVLLQLVFPSYIIFLSVLIIILSTYWGRFAGIIGRKNPVATLCTLILLSYSKLLRAIITMLQSTTLTYPDHSGETVWLYDPNVGHFTITHAPRFIFATIIVILGAAYTTMLFFGQWFRKYSNQRLLRWARDSRYNAFVDAYHAPFLTKHRYWIGVLLQTRIIHHLLTALLAESTHLLVVTCIVGGVLIMKLYLKKIYKSWPIDFLETAYLLNLLLFVTGTYYIRDTRGDQTVVANTSVFVAFFTFLGTVAYHLHTYCLTGYKTYNKLVAAIMASRTILEQMFKKRVTRTSHQSHDTLNTPSQHQHNTPCGHIQQLREPALDIIAPLLTEDYARPAPTTIVSRPVTSTIVEVEDIEFEESV